MCKDCKGTGIVDTKVGGFTFPTLCLSCSKDKIKTKPVSPWFDFWNKCYKNAYGQKVDFDNDQVKLGSGGIGVAIIFHDKISDHYFSPYYELNAAVMCCKDDLEMYRIDFDNLTASTKKKILAFVLKSYKHWGMDKNEFDADKKADALTCQCKYCYAEKDPDMFLESMQYTCDWSKVKWNEWDSEPAIY